MIAKLLVMACSSDRQTVNSIQTTLVFHYEPWTIIISVTNIFSYFLLTFDDLTFPFYSCRIFEKYSRQAKKTKTNFKLQKLFVAFSLSCIFANHPKTIHLFSFSFLKLCIQHLLFFHLKKHFYLIFHWQTHLLFRKKIKYHLKGFSVFVIKHWRISRNNTLTFFQENQLIFCFIEPSSL